MRVLFCLGLLATVVSAAKKCKLIQTEADKPFPSLTQCYKDNQRACCVSAHDEFIAAEYSGLLSGTCLREFSMLEMYYCLGCNPDQPSFIQGSNVGQQVISNATLTSPLTIEDCGNQTLHICNSFAAHLFGFVVDSTGSPSGFKCPKHSGSSPNTKCKDGIRQYDRCGFKDSDGKGFLPSAKFALGKACPVKATDSCDSLLQTDIENARDNFFKNIRPPFFDAPKYEGPAVVETVDGKQVLKSGGCGAGLYTGYKIVFEDDSSTCLSAASSFSFSPLALALGLVAMLFNLVSQS